MKRLLLIFCLAPVTLFAQGSTDGGKVPLQGNQIGGIGADGKFHFASTDNTGKFNVVASSSNVNGQATMANSSPVVIASDQSAVPVTLPTGTLTIVTSSVSSSGSVATGKIHIEFILSTDFAGTIGGTTVPTNMGIYNPGTPPNGKTFGSLAYTITAGSAFLTTW